MLARHDTRPMNRASGRCEINRPAAYRLDCAAERFVGVENHSPQTRFGEARISRATSSVFRLFAFIGVSHADWQTRHRLHEKFEVDESALPIGAWHVAWRSRRSHGETAPRGSDRVTLSRPVNAESR